MRAKPWKLPKGTNLTHTDCSMSFKRRQCLQKHLKSHSGERLEMCPQCPKTFVYSESLLRHKRKHCEKSLTQKPNHKRRFQCSQCSMSFVRKSYLRSHLESHPKFESSVTLGNSHRTVKVFPVPKDVSQ